MKQLPDHLNAEVVSGTVTSIDEAVAWLSYTYLYVRMLKNPLAYGLPFDARADDPQLTLARYDRAVAAAKLLDERRMLRFDPRSGNLAVTDLGRTASHFYITHVSVDTFNRMLGPHLSDSAALAVLCHANEFDNVKVRPEELIEMDKLRKWCPLEVRGQQEEAAAKVSVLMQAYISNARPTGFTLISDTNYAAQNGARVARALFEIALRKGLCSLATTFLRLARAIDRRLWWWESPLRQLAAATNSANYRFPDNVLANLEKHDVSVEQLLEMDHREVGGLVHHERMGRQVKEAARTLPVLGVAVDVQPVTRQILRLTVTLTAAFSWAHGLSEPFWVWCGDSEHEHIYHSEHVTLTRKQHKLEPMVLAFTIPVAEPLPAQYQVHVLPDRWVGLDQVVPVSFKHLILPDRHPPHTDLLDLTPLPVAALGNPLFEALYKGKISHFNPIQTQVFHTLYHTDSNVLLGAPTSSGKTLVAELSILRMLNLRMLNPSRAAQEERTSKAGGGGDGGGGDTAAEGVKRASDRICPKAVYVAPLKALARERVKDWRARLGKGLGLNVLELTGDVTPDAGQLRRADLIITTPEKWDGVTRQWRTRDYVKAVSFTLQH